MLDKLRWILLPLVILLIPLMGYLTWDSLRVTPERARQRFVAMRGSFWGGTIANIGCKERNAGPALRELQNTPEAAKIRWIRFGGRYLSTTDIAMLGKFPQLDGVEFHGSHFSPQDFIALAKSTPLRTLNLQSLWRVSNFAPVAEQFTSLDTLCLDECEIDNDSAQQLADHGTLLTLSISRSQLSSEALAKLLASKSIATLFLCEAKLVDAIPPHLSAPSHLTNLYWVCGDDDFDRCGELLGSTQDFPNIKTLTLGCKIDRVLECVKQMKVHSNLGSLTIIVEKLPPAEMLHEVKSISGDISIQVRDRQDREWGNSAGYSRPDSNDDAQVE